MPTMPAICVWRPSALTWGERYDKQVKRAARRLAGRCRAAQHMGVGVGVRRRGAAVAMAMTRGRALPQTPIAAAAPADDRRGTALWGEWDGGGFTLCRCFDRGVSILQQLIGSFVECCSEGCDLCVGVWSLYHSIEIYRKMIAQPGTSEGVYRTDLRGVATWCGRYCPHDDTFAQGTQIMRGRTCQPSLA